MWMTFFYLFQLITPLLFIVTPLYFKLSGRGFVNIYLILTTNLQGRHYPYFTDEGTEAQSGQLS